jgi:mono/diheme cytochrome c family protein
MRKGFLVVAAIAFGLGGVAVESVVVTGGSAQDPVLERGRYLVQIGGCNDCHTPGYAARNGQVPEAGWLVGDSLGYSGPWGTTYPTNLRRYLSAMNVDAWIEQAQTLETRPPMPWFNLRAFSEGDLRAIYKYIRSLPADDTSVPEYVPPDQKPKTPYLVMAPQPPER